MNTTIKMTAKQTNIYDNGTEPEQRALMDMLRAEAIELSKLNWSTVEVETNDGVVVLVQHA